MATIVNDISRTFSEFLLIPKLTKLGQSPASVSLVTPLAAYKKYDVAVSDSSKTLAKNSTGSVKGVETSRLTLQSPLMSSAMQAVSCPDLAIALAMNGGIASIHCSQPIESQVSMVKAVKSFKAGFVNSRANVSLHCTLGTVRNMVENTGHSTVAVTGNGEARGVFKGLVFASDIWPEEGDDQAITHVMRPVEELATANVGISLEDAVALLKSSHQKCIPILQPSGELDSLVFKRDAFSSFEYPHQLLDENGRLRVSAAINTHDFRERAPALIDAGVDALFFDSSDGYSEYQHIGIQWLREQYGDDLVVGAGNIVCSDGFSYLVEVCGADFVKVGIGGGSICVTREQKGIGRGQASALLDVVKARNEYLDRTGIYVPICSDGGLSNDTEIIIALAMGADFVMMGRYFAALEESASAKVTISGKHYKAYWGEGSFRAKNWQRYNSVVDTADVTETVVNKNNKLSFEEGVDAYVPYMGTLSEALGVSMSKLKSAMVNCGAVTLATFAQTATLTMVSPQSFREGGTSTVLLKNHLLE